MKPTLIAALKAAGEIQRNNFNKPTRISQKESLSSVVTETDIQCEKVIMNIIAQSFPSHSILTEESGYSGNNSEFTWVIDPLDGTSNFAAGVPWFGVLIALFKNQKPILGGAYLPVTDQLYFAETGKGAYFNEERITVAENPMKNSLFGFSTDYTENHEFLDKGMDTFRFIVQNSRNVRTTNSLVDLMYVAEGKFGGCINLFNRIWDIAAPYVIINEAGGTVKDLYGRELDFELTRVGVNKNYPVFSGAKTVYKEMNGFLSTVFN